MTTRKVLALIAVLAILAGFAVPVFAQGVVVTFPANFCQNADGTPFNSTDKKLPESDPCGGNSTFEVVSRELPIGVFAKDVTIGLDWTEARKSISGIIWARPKANTTAPAINTPVAQVAAVTTAQVSECMKRVTRDERLGCLDPVYRSGGTEAWLKALGFSGKLNSVDARQPDEYVLPRGQTVRGVQVNLSGTLPDGFSCVTTDAFARVPKYRLLFKIPNTNPVVGMFGGGVEVNGPVSVWGDCSDWPEFAAMLKSAPVQDAIPTVSPTATALPSAGTTPTRTIDATSTPTPTATAKPTTGTGSNVAASGFPWWVLWCGIPLLVVVVLGLIFGRSILAALRARRAAAPADVPVEPDEPFEPLAPATIAPDARAN